MTVEILLWIVGLVVVTVLYWYLSVPKGLPPGSAGLPILGYLPFLNREAYHTLGDLGKKYGNLYYLYFGSQLVIVLNDYDTIKKAFINQGEIFSGRPPVFRLSDDENDNLGVTATEGEFWKQHRRFITMNLKDRGVSDLTNEPLMLEEIDHLINELRSSVGHPVEARDILMKSLVNVLNVFIFGHRLEYQDPKLRKIIRNLNEILHYVPHICLTMFFPWLRWLPGSDTLTKKDILKHCNKKFLHVVSEIIRTVKIDFTDGLRSNYVQAYLTKQNERLRENVKENVFTDVGLEHNTRDLIGAGAETTATSLLWILLYMTRYPDVQEKVQQELDRVVGRERKPSLNDRANTPYTEATLCEVQRIVSLSALSIQRRTTKETTLLGYRIPADAMVLPVLYSVHHNPKVWGDPENFRPERFLGTDGSVIRSEHLIPFSIGKRSCMGEPVAKMEMYLYLTSLLLNFDFIPPNGVEPSLDSVPGIHRFPKTTVICVRERPTR